LVLEQGVLAVADLSPECQVTSKGNFLRIVSILTVTILNLLDTRVGRGKPAGKVFI